MKASQFYRLTVLGDAKILSSWLLMGMILQNHSNSTQKTRKSISINEGTGLIIAAVIGLVAIGPKFWADHQLASNKAKTDLIISAITTGSRTQAKENIKFFIKAELIDDGDEKIKGALDKEIMPWTGTGSYSSIDDYRDFQDNIRFYESLKYLGEKKIPLLNYLNDLSELSTTSTEVATFSIPNDLEKVITTLNQDSINKDSIDSILNSLSEEEINDLKKVMLTVTEAFQKWFNNKYKDKDSRQLTADGIVGPKTYKALECSLAVSQNSESQNSESQNPKQSLSQCLNK